MQKDHTESEKNHNASTMETPVTPKKTRPRLTTRSHTSSGAFSSPPKAGDQRLPPKDPPQDAKRYPFDLFHHHNHSTTSNNNHHHPRNHHSPTSSRTKDKSSSGSAGKVRDLKHHVAKPVAELSSAVSTGANHVRNVKEDISAKSSRRASREIPSELVFASRVPSQAVTSGDVERQRYKRRQQEEALKQAFDDLSDTAQSSARRFDFIYYSALEKVSRLHAMIASLQELSKGSTKLRDDFEAESQNLVDDAKRQINAFEEFSAMQGDVRGLEKRITRGKEKAEGLAERLEEARRQTERWEEGELEWQARTTKRLTIVQFVLLAVIVLIVGLVWFRRHVDGFSSREADVKQYEKIVNESSLPQFIVDDLAELRSSRLATQTSSETDSSGRPEQTLLPDRRLLGFDEL